MRIGIIDLGSNTFNLLVWDDHFKETIFNTKIPVKIGKGGYEKGLIVEDAQQRAIEALKIHKTSAINFKVDSIFAIATSAIRSATNGNEFCERAFNETGIAINVIDGDEEAVLIKLGVEQAIEESNDCKLIIDIGGGSTEFIIYEGYEVQWQKSYPLGVSRMLERFGPSDPLSKNDIERINTELENDLVELWQNMDTYQPSRIIGSSGSFETFYTCLAFMNHHAHLIEHQVNAFMSTQEFISICDQIIVSNYEERLSLEGMPEMRADSIQLSSLLCKLILSKKSFNYLELSLYALKEGVIQTITKNNHKWQESLL